MTPHTFRHTFAVEYLRANPGDVLRLQAILGHSTLEMVRRYVRYVEQDLMFGYERASPADRLRETTGSQRLTKQRGTQARLRLVADQSDD